MATIDVNQVGLDIIEAIKGVVEGKWPEVKAFATAEAKSFAQNMAQVELMHRNGDITDEQARLLAKMHRNSMEVVLSALEGVGLALAEKAVNAAIAVIRTAINNAIGFAIL